MATVPSTTVPPKFGQAAVMLNVPEPGEIRFTVPELVNAEFKEVPFAPLIVLVVPDMMFIGFT